eukprot:scaffold41073_cov63-Phaeocystis_antarctica.AAC.7
MPGLGRPDFKIISCFLTADRASRRSPEYYRRTAKGRPGGRSGRLICTSPAGSHPVRSRESVLDI